MLLSYVGMAIGVIVFVLSSLGKRVVCRVIPSASIKLPIEITQVATIIM